MSVQPKGDPDAMVKPMIQTPKAAIPAEINNESALFICVPFQGLAQQERGRQLKWRRSLLWSMRRELRADSSAFLTRSRSVFNSHN